MIEKPKTNLRVMKRSRKKPQAGDIFTFQLELFPERYFFGLVVKTDTKIGNLDDVVLVYLYKTTSPEKTMIPELSLDDLMTVPLGVSNQVWFDGYLETVSSTLIQSERIFKKHCFKSLTRPGVFYDEYGNRLGEAIEPCGEWAMGWHLAIDRAASNFMDIQIRGA